MKGLILAAGTASRLRPLTENTPKCLLKINGRTILERTVDYLIDNQITDITIVTGYLEKMIKEYLRKRYPDIEFNYIFNEIYDKTNNIYSLWLAERAVSGDDLLLLDSDIVFDKRIISLLINSEKGNCLALRSVGGIGDEEIKVTADNNLRILQISKSVDISNAIGESIGIEKFSAESVNKLFNILDKMINEEGKTGIFYEAAFERLINSGTDIYAIDVGNLKCMELDTIEDFNSAGNIINSIDS